MYCETVYFFINAAYNFILPFCEDRFITAMFTAVTSCVNNRIIETLHDAWVGPFTSNVIFFSNITALGKYLPQFIVFYDP